ncbi:precorrin-2 C(20)-methyltransferase [Pelotalea chapellei]|uniref:Precorrin-2 C(20)-methyltransferase n=1 Tax=Pelotalea chapellei TaxID=44671 RepID=A0ABS5U887_9BACT|nr:precorrin-2 C(20)-methyltransferase [Pelotalea chapellei]MBT1071871.1 precorrin-2 C(20)-methyltransferase [Pelotalea chapellei]
MMDLAKIYAIGVGPGDPELVTRKAERILRQANVILAPVARLGETSVALETVKEFLDGERQEIILHQFPMTADTSILVPAWEAAVSMMAEQVRLGRSVAFITIGDPLLYSTFIYLLRILRTSYPEIAVEIVPGISSINTAAAVAEVSLAESEDRIVIIPATAGIEKIIEALAKYETVVLLKVKPLYADILELLKQTGRASNSIFVERAGSARQKVLRGVDAMATHSPDYLSLIIVTTPHD